MPSATGSECAAALAAQLDAAMARLIAVIETVDADRWRRVPGPGVWSISKDAEHVAEAAVYHQWIVRRTVGQQAPSRRPAIERRQLSSGQSRSEAVALIRERTEEGRALLIGLTDAQLDLPTKPPRAGDERLHATIERVLIGHYDVHRVAIEAKLLATAPRRRIRMRASGG